jgi:hypothetical protein
MAQQANDVLQRLGDFPSMCKGIALKPGDVRLHVILYSIGFVICCNGCVTTVQPRDGDPLRVSSREFRAYAERIFRLQNEVASEIALRLEDAEPADVSALEAAEDALLDACAQLNATAARRRDGGGVRPFSDLSTARSVPACETAALAAQRQLTTRSAVGQ